MRVEGTVLVNDLVVRVLRQYLEALGLVKVLIAVDDPVDCEEIQEESVAFSLDDIVADCVQVAQGSVNE